VVSRRPYLCPYKHSKIFNRKGSPSHIPKKSITAFSKNTPIMGFFVCHRKGKFEIVVISIIFGKAVYFKMLYLIPEERNVLKAK